MTPTQGGYLALPNAVVDHFLGTDDMGRVVWLWLRADRRRYEPMRLATSYLRQHWRCGQSTVERLLRDLEELGVVEIMEPGGPRTPRLIRVYDPQNRDARRGRPSGTPVGDAERDAESDGRGPGDDANRDADRDARWGRPLGTPVDEHRSTPTPTPAETSTPSLLSPAERADENESPAPSRKRKSKRPAKETWIAESWELCRRLNGRLGLKPSRAYRAACGAKGGPIDCEHTPAELAEVYEWARGADHPRAQYLRDGGLATPTTCARHLSDYLALARDPNPPAPLNGVRADATPLSDMRALRMLYLSWQSHPQPRDGYGKTREEHNRLKALVDRVGGWERFCGLDETQRIEIYGRSW